MILIRSKVSLVSGQNSLHLLLFYPCSISPSLSALLSFFLQSREKDTEWVVTVWVDHLSVFDLEHIDAATEQSNRADEGWRVRVHTHPPTHLPVKCYRTQSDATARVCSAGSLQAGSVSAKCHLPVTEQFVSFDFIRAICKHVFQAYGNNLTYADTLCPSRTDVCLRHLISTAEAYYSRFSWHSYLFENHRRTFKGQKTLIFFVLHIHTYFSSSLCYELILKHIPAQMNVLLPSEFDRVRLNPWEH